MRNLILFLLVLVGIWWVRRALGRARTAKQAPKAEAAKGRAGATSMERVLECAHCGVHVPESEGVSVEGRFYCSEAHRRLGPGR